MEGGLNPQRGFEQKEPELDIPPLQSEGVQFEVTFPKPMMYDPTYTTRPSSQPSFIEPPPIETSPHQTPPTADHAPWMDLSALISSLGTRMEELAVVSDTRFYSMKDCMDQYQTSFTSQFEYLQQRIGCIESHQESQHEEMMAYLRSVFPPPPPQP